MKSRAVRFALQALFVALLAAAGYAVWQSESAAVAAATPPRTFDERARAVARSFLEIKAAQPGYVAAGQGEDYWVARVAALVGATRDGLASLQPQPGSRRRAPSSTAPRQRSKISNRWIGAPANTSAAVSACWPRTWCSRTASKVDAAVAAIERAQAAERTAGESAIKARRQEQLLAAGGAAALGVLIVSRWCRCPARNQSPREGESAGRESAPEERTASPLSITRTPAPAGNAVITPPDPPPSALPAPAPAPALAAPPVPSSPGVDLPGIAALCSDLARVIDTRSLPAALARAASLLNASGLVIWVADPDGRELAPVIAHGYPQHLLSRMGTIPRDAENATASAYRTGLVQIVTADDISPGAIAAPLLSPSGPLGVMAAELLQDGERRDATRAAATIVAAQLSTLMGPPPPPAARASPK